MAAEGTLGSNQIQRRRAVNACYKSGAGPCSCAVLCAMLTPSHSGPNQRIQLPHPHSQPPTPCTK